MKNNSMFAATSPKSYYIALIVVAFFIATLGAVICKDKGLSNHNGLPHSCCNLTLASRGAIAFLVFNTSIFHHMPKSVKNCSRAKHSTTTATPNRAKTVSIAAVQLPVSNPYSIPCFEDFIAEASRRFEVECNAKNKAYSFILSNGLLTQFEAFSKQAKGVDHHALSLSLLSNQ